MQTEPDYLRQLSDLLAGATLLSASLRMGIEGTLNNRMDLPELAARLQTNLEEALAVIESRRRQLEPFAS